MPRRELTIADLLDLAVLDEERAASEIRHVYDWLYAHAMGRAKGLAGFGSAILISTVLPVFSTADGTTTNWTAVVGTWVGSGVLIGIGIATYFRARRLHLEYLWSLSLLGRLRSLRRALERTGSA